MDTTGNECPIPERQEIHQVNEYALCRVERRPLECALTLLL